MTPSEALTRPPRVTNLRMETMGEPPVDPCEICCDRAWQPRGAVPLSGDAVSQGWRDRAPTAPRPPSTNLFSPRPSQLLRKCSGGRRRSPAGSAAPGAGSSAVLGVSSQLDKASEACPHQERGLCVCVCRGRSVSCLIPSWGYSENTCQSPGPVPGTWSVLTEGT